MLKRMLVVMVMLTGCLSGSQARWAKRASLAAGNAAILCDLSQTLWMADGGKWDHGLSEMNPVLGRYPGTGTIIGASLGSIAVNTALYYLLPGSWGTYVNGGVLLVEGANVTTQPNNPQMGYADHHHGCDLQRKF